MPVKQEFAADGRHAVEQVDRWPVALMILLPSVCRPAADDGDGRSVRVKTIKNRSEGRFALGSPCGVVGAGQHVVFQFVGNRHVAQPDFQHRRADMRTRTDSSSLSL